MPLLADAYAEAHLDLDPLDRDLDEAQAKLTAAFRKLEQAAKIDVELDTAQAQREMKTLEASIRDKAVQIEVEVDQDSLEQLALQFEGIDQQVKIEVELVGTAQAASELGALRTLAEAVDKGAIDIDVDASEIATASALLAAFQVQLSEADAYKIDVDVNTDQVLAAIAELEVLVAKLEREDATVEIRADVDGVTKAIAELEALRQTAANLNNKTVRIDVEVDGQAATLAELALLDAETSGLDKVIHIDIDIDDLTGVMTALAGLGTELQGLRATTARPINIEVDLKGLETGLLQIVGIEAAMAAVAGQDLDLSIDIDIEGVTAAIAELSVVKAAVESLRVDDVIIRIRPGSTTSTIAELYDLRRELALIQSGAELDIDVDVEGGAEAIAELTVLDNLVQSLTDRAIRLNVTIKDLPETITKLADLEVQVEALDGKNANIDTKLVGSADVLAQMGALQVAVESMPEHITYKVDTDGVAQALSEVTILDEVFDHVDRTTARPEIDVKGIKGALADITKVIAGLKAIPNRVSTTISTKVSGLSRLRSLSSLLKGGKGGRGGIFSGLTRAASSAFSGVTRAMSGMFPAITRGITDMLSQVSRGIGAFTQSLGSGAFGQISEGFKGVTASVKGLGETVPMLGKVGSGLSKVGGAFTSMAGPMLKFNAFAALATTAAVLVAWLIPLAAGFVAAAAGLVIFGAAAGAAAIGVAALAVLLDPSIMEEFKAGFTGLKLVVENELQPIIGLVKNQFIPQLFGALGTAAKSLAPYITDFLVPIADSVFLLIEDIGQIAGPALKPLADGLSSFINILGKFMVASQDLAVTGIGALFDSLNAMLELLGQIGVAMSPILETMGRGFAELNINSIGPFMQIIHSFGQALEPLGGSLGRILRPLGDLTVTFGEIVAQGAGVLDVFYDMATLIFPPLNFAVMQDLAKNTFPSILDFARRLQGPMQKMKETMGDIFQRLFTPENTANIQGLFEGIMVAIDAVLSAFDSVGTTDIFGFLIEGAAQFIAILLQIGAIGADAMGGLIQGLDVVLEGIAGVADGWGKLLNTLDFLPFIDNGAGDGMIEWAENTQDALDDTRETLFGLGDGLRTGAEAISGFSGELGVAGNGLNILDEDLKSNWQALEQIGAITPLVVGEYRALDPAAQAAAQSVAALTEQFKATLSATEELNAEGASKSGFAEFIDKEAFSVSGALDDYRSSITLKLDNLKKINFLDALGFDDIQSQLADLDPEMFSKAFDEIFSEGLDGAQDIETQFEALSARLDLAAAGLNADLSSLLDEGGDEAALNMKKFFTDIRDAVQAGQKSITDLSTGEKVDITGIEVASDGAVPPDVQESIDSTAGASGEAYTSAMEEAFKGSGEAVSAQIGEALNTAVTDLSPVMEAFGKEVAVAIGTGFAATLDEGDEYGVQAAMKTLFSTLSTDNTELAEKLGDDIGLKVMEGFSTGIDTGSVALAAALGELMASIGVVGMLTSEAIGRVIGLQLSVSLAEGMISTTGVAVAGVQAIVTAVGEAAIFALTSVGDLVGKLFATSIAAGLLGFIGVVKGAVTATITAAFSQGAALVIPLGSLTGRLFALGIMTGILSSKALIQSALASAVNPGAVLGLAQALSFALGSTMSAAIAAGVLAVGAVIAAAVSAVVAAAARVGQAVGVATMRVAGVSSAVSFASGVISAMGALAGSVATFARVVGVRVGLAFTAGLQTGITSGMAGVDVPIGNLASVGPALRAIGFSAGNQFGAGLSSGIRAGLGAAEAAARATAARIAAAVKDALQIASPSKVMAKIGKEVGNGLAKGIEDSQVTVDAAAAGMAKLVKEFDFTDRVEVGLASAGQIQTNSQDAKDMLTLVDANRVAAAAGAVTHEAPSIVNNNNITVQNPSGDPARAGTKIARRLELGFKG